jgi:hypothetical protein
MDVRPRRFDRTGQNAATFVVEQQGKLSVARERQLVRVACFVEVFNRLAVHRAVMVPKVERKSILERRHWQSRWHPKKMPTGPPGRSAHPSSVTHARVTFSSPVAY